MKIKMLPSLIAFSIILTLLLASDDIDKMKPQDVLKKACHNSLVKKGFHYNYETETEQQKYTLSGIFNAPDLFSFTGSFEGFKKGKKVVLKDDQGKWTTADKIKDKPEIDVITVFNPQNFLNDVSKATATKFSDADEEVNSISCKIIEAAGKSDRIKDYAGSLKNAVKNALRVEFDITSYVDYKKSTVSYKIYVGKEDFLIYCIKQKVDVKLKEGIPNPTGIPIPQAFTFNDTITYSNYEKDITIEIPPEAKKLLGVK